MAATQLRRLRQAIFTARSNAFRGTNWRVPLRSRGRWMAPLGQAGSATAAASRRKARSAESRTQTSRNRGKPERRAKASWADGSTCGGNCGKAGFRRESRRRTRTDISDRALIHPCNKKIRDTKSATLESESTVIRCGQLFQCLLCKDETSRPEFGNSAKNRFDNINDILSVLWTALPYFCSSRSGFSITTLGSATKNAAAEAAAFRGLSRLRS